MVLVSHDMDLVRRRCDEVAVLERGALALLGDPAEATAYHLDRRRAAGDVDPSGTRLFDPSPRGEAGRRRRGV